MEFQNIITHLARRRRFSITNVYLPPHRFGYFPYLQNDMSWLDYLPKEICLACTEFNANHNSWDDCLYSRSELGASLLDGSTLKGCAKRWFSNASRKGQPWSWNQYAGYLAGGYGYGSSLFMGSHARTLIRSPPVVA